MASSEGTTYHVSVDFEAFKQIYLAQNGKYLHKTGISCLVIGAVLTCVAIWMLVSSPSLETLGMVVLFLAITIYGGVQATHPFTFFQTRKGEAYTYFASHGAEVTAGEALEDLSVEFDVTVEQLGFVERLADGSAARRPWFTLTGDVASCPFGRVLPGDDGKNSSMLYNMLGVNAYLREGLEGEPLLVPAAVVSGNPGLVQQVADLVSQSRETYGRKGTKADDAARDRLAAWLQG